MVDLSHIFCYYIEKKNAADEMDIEKFLMMFRQTINEFYFLNNHFNAKPESKTEDYDNVYMRWVRDMAQRFRNLNLRMHWATSSKFIAENQIILDVLYQSVYLFEVKYHFGDAIHPSFDSIIAEFKEIERDFSALNEFYDFENNDKTKDYDKFFYDWRKNYQLKNPDMIVDILWGKNTENIADNTLYLNLIFKDLFLFQIKYVQAGADKLGEEETE